MTLVEHVLYPSLIHRACSIVDEWDVLKNQPDCFFRVILRIVKKVNIAQPKSAVFAKRATLALEAGQSVQTVNRTIKWLETEGLITRQKKAHQGLRGSSSPLVLSDQFLHLLMLDPLSIQQSYAEAEEYVLQKYAQANGLKHDVAKPNAHADAVYAADQEEGRAQVTVVQTDAAPETHVEGIAEASSAQAVEDELQSVVSSTDLTASTASTADVIALGVPNAAAAGEPEVDMVVETPAIPALAAKYQAAINRHKAATAQRAADRNDRRGFVQFGDVKIPADLSWLVTNLDMRATGVLELMGIAKKANQTLSDVVKAVSKYLSDLDGREAYAYLRKLLGLGKDFGYKVREMTQQQNAEDERDYLALKAEALAGRSFFSPKSQAQYTIQPDGLVEVLQNGKHSAMRLCRKMLDAIDAGKLRAVRA